MRSVAVSLAAVVLSVGCASLDESAKWIDIKDPIELRALFSNTITTGTTWYHERWIGKYWADGEGQFEPPNGARIHLYWEVVGNDQVCFTSTSWGTRCSRYARHRMQAGVYRRYNPENQHEYDEFWTKKF